MNFNKLTIITFILQILSCFSELYYGILHIGASEGDKFLNRDYCISYNPQFALLPSADQSINAAIVDMTSPFFNDLCNDNTEDYKIGKNKLIFVLRGNCTFLKKATNAISIGAKGLVVVNPQQFLFDPLASKNSDYPVENMSVSILTYNDFQDFRQFSLNEKHFASKIYAIDSDCLTNGMIFIFLIAFVTIFVGSYWSGVTAYAESMSITRVDSDKGQQPVLSWKYIISMVVLMCGVLLLLYFFYKYLVYFFIGVYVLGGSLSILHCVRSVILLFSPDLNKRRIDCSKKKKVPTATLR